MTKKLLIIVPLVVLATLVFLTSQRPKTKMDPFTIGSSIPELRFKDIHGNDYFFNDFKGKAVLINHWATWCQYCLVELPHLETLRKEYDRNDLEILTILHDTENQDLAKEIIQDYELTIPVLLANGHPSLALIESSGLPYSVLLDRQGIIRFIHRGFSPADVKKFTQELDYLLDEK